MADYDTDILEWSERQAALLRRRASGELVNEAELERSDSRTTLTVNTRTTLASTANAWRKTKPALISAVGYGHRCHRRGN